VLNGGVGLVEAYLRIAKVESYPRNFHATLHRKKNGPEENTLFVAEPTVWPGLQRM
jgi:endo-alpha-1,4-polygalactosaminidase (GH114 family)